MCAVYDRDTCVALNAALLSYEKLAKMFEEWYLIMNPRDPCVWNKEDKNKQLTIMFHIDDFLIARLDSMIVTKHVKKLDKNMVPMIL